MQAIDKLLSLGAKTVFLTSMEHETKPVNVVLGKNQKGMYITYDCIIYTHFKLFVGESARVEMPKIPALFTGTGDMFCAMLLAWGHESLQVISQCFAL